MQYLGVDIGTTSLSFALIDSEQQQVLWTQSHRHAADIIRGDGFSHWQDAESLLEQTQAHTQSYLARFPHVRGIGLSGQMHGMVYVYAQGKVISPLVTWLDKGFEQQSPQGISFQEQCLQETGERLRSGYAMASHYINQCLERVPATAASFCSIADALWMRLAGRQEPYCDASVAASFGLFDVRAGRFRDESWQRLNRSALRLPRLSSQTKLWPVSFAPELWVTPTLGDNQASFIGSCQDLDDSLLVNIGTSGQISFLSPYYDSEPLELRPFPLEGCYLAVGASLTGGKALEVLERFFHDVARKLGLDIDNAWSLFQRGKRERVSLEVDSRLAGSHQNPDIRGSVQNIGLHNFSADGLASAFCQAVIDELLAFLPDPPPEKTRLITSGNALGANPLLRDRLEQSLQQQALSTSYKEEAAVGAALYVGALLEERPLAEFCENIVHYS